MKDFFRDIFYFRKDDRRAVVALCVIAVFAIGVLLVVDAMKGNEEYSLAEVQESNRTEENQEEELLYIDKNGVDGESQDVKLCVFDPNTIDSITLISFGLDERKVRNFLHYRKAGAKFRSADDLKKTYGWTEDDVERLRKYVKVQNDYTANSNIKLNDNVTSLYVVEKESEITQPVQKSNKYNVLTTVDVNTADSAQLCRIPGVGTKISMAIIKYRNKVGGFYSVEQLKEISIVSPELLEWFCVGDVDSNIKRIRINTASFQVLNSHPYISYEQTKAILRYLRLYGKIESAEQLSKINIFSEDELKKVMPYLDFE